ncbi:MAG: HD-GYP domain-containing protein [Candidatus Omnitrophica bacterium]|nr:HD-GYP domain-containing protein [Candidatus Omnitrophota bacterium]
MKIFFSVILISIFFAGIFIGFSLRRTTERRRKREVWDRFERRSIMRTINALVSAIDFKDHLTKKHSDNVKHYACIISKEFGLTSSEVGVIKEACQVHDLGKIGIHDNILTKPDKLTDQEYKEIKSHALAGAVILKPFHFLNKVVEIVRQHHERYDGKGYPDGLIGDDICIEARIMSVADSFEAMTSKRPYRDPMTKEKAMEELKKHSGTQFDPKIVEVFLKILETQPEIFKDPKE